MKATITSLLTATCMLFSFPLFADDKVVITGEPVTLEQSGDVYTAPSGYTSTGSYHYVMVNDTRWVCYADMQPSLASLDVMTVNVSVGGEQVVWNCYGYDPEYFVLE